MSGLLEARSRDLAAEIRDALEHSENQRYIELLDGEPAVVGDQSFADMLADLNIAIVHRHVRDLRDVDAAKARIGDGSYGGCVDCGLEIGIDRLRVQPSAQRCIVCQEQREKVFAHEATPTL